jgi:integrase
MAKRLTDIAIRNLKPRPTRYEVPGGDGLYVIVQPVTGAKTFAVRFRVDNHPAKLTIGPWPKVSLADARVAAIKARERVKQGEDPAKAKQDDKVRADAAKADTVTAVCENYLVSLEAKKLRSRAARISILRRHVYPVLGDKPVGAIRRGDIARLLDKVEANAGPRMADVTLGVLRRIFHWRELRDDEFRSPIIRGMQRQKTAEHRRTRVLDDAEIRAVWQATADDSPFSALVRVLLLSGARRNEIARMKWDEIDASGLWTLPASRSKTGAEVARPLSAAAQALLAELPRIDGCPFVFVSATGRTPISQFSTPKQKLDIASGTRGWILHDLRRTSRSLLSRASVNVDTAERCLGHAMPAIRATYDRHQYLDEMRRGFEALSALVARIVNPPKGDIVPLRRQR